MGEKRVIKELKKEWNGILLKAVPNLYWTVPIDHTHFILCQTVTFSLALLGQVLVRLDFI